MAKVKGICRNEDCIKLNEIQEVEKSEFVCPECGGSIYRLDWESEGCCCDCGYTENEEDY